MSVNQTNSIDNEISKRLVARLRRRKASAGVMEEQTMSQDTFFNELCGILQLSNATADEDEIVRAVRRASHRSSKLSEMSEEAKRIWEALPPETVLPPAIDNLLRWLIKS